MFRFKGSGASNDPLPAYMDPVEFGQVLAIVESVAPRVLLEWGAGGSTKALLENASSIDSYIAVEHDDSWVEEVRRHVTDPRLALHHVPPDIETPPDGAGREEIIAWCQRCEDDPAAMRSYVTFPRGSGIRPELVLVDGRARIHCIREGFDILSPGGVLILHDAQRRAYHPALLACGRAVFLEPFVRGQVALVRKPDA